MAFTRFLFVSGTDLTSAPGPWSSSVTGDDPHRAWFAWRLVGSNNRELGRSYTAHRGLFECQSEALDLKTSAGYGEGVPLADFDTGRWYWRYDVDGRTVAVAGRTYDRRREAISNLNHFLSNVPQAEMAADLIRRRPYARPSNEGRLAR